MASLSGVTEYIDGIPVHPVASLFPMIGGEELQALADDIKANGQREAIQIGYADLDATQEVVIDGRNRYAACKLAGVEPTFLINPTLDPEQIGPWIMSHNRHRRHMSKTQMATVAVEYEKWLAVEAKKRYDAGVRKGAEVTNSGGRSEENFPQSERAPQASDEAGAMLGVSGRTVRDAKYVANNDPELFEKMRRNEITASAAARQLREKSNPTPPPTREQIVDKLTRPTLKEDEATIRMVAARLLEYLGEECPWEK